MQLNEELRRLRNIKKLSLRDVRELTGISPSTLSRLECGLSKIGPDDLRKLAKAYDISCETLMRLAGYMDSDAPSQKLEIEMSDDEAKELLRYLEFLRWKGRKK